MDVLLALGINDFIPFEPVPTEAGKTVGTRREWRIKKETGDLRGISIREANKGRKSVGWLDKQSQGWGAILKEYEAWRRKPRYAVGTLEQPAEKYDRQPTGADTRLMPE